MTKGENRKLELYDQYASLTKGVKARAQSYVSNCFLLPRDAKRLIEEGLLSYELVSQDCLVLYIDKGDHVQLMVSFDDAARPVAKPDLPPSCVIENPFSADDVEADLPPSSAALRQIALEWGFETIRTSRRLELPLDGFSVERRDFQGVEHAFHYDAPVLRSMLDEGFDSRCDYVPSDRELALALDERRVLCVRDDAGRCAAFLHYDVGRASELRHLFVSEECRGQGLARKLIARYLCDVADQARSAYLWVRDDNGPALSLYSSFGYQFQGRRSEEYYRKGEQK